MNNLKYYRVKKKLSQMQLAKKIKVHQPAISLWECGKVKPSLMHAQKLAIILNTSLDKLLKNGGKNA